MKIAGSPLPRTRRLTISSFGVLLLASVILYAMYRSPAGSVSLLVDSLLDADACCNEDFVWRKFQQLYGPQAQKCAAFGVNAFVTFEYLPSNMRLGNMLTIYGSLLGIGLDTCHLPIIFDKPKFPLFDYFQLSVMNISRQQLEEMGYAFNMYEPSKGKSGVWDPYIDKIVKHNESYVLRGYLQSWKYLIYVPDLIRKEFTYREHIQKEADRIISTALQNLNLRKSDVTLTGVHIRRGDFLNPSNVRWGFYAPNETYVYRAMDYVRRNASSARPPLFLVLGSEYKWNKAKFGKIKDVVVLPTSDRIVDLCVLSSTQRFVMTVGTYGWWAAYLTGGTVVCSRQQVQPNSTRARRISVEDHIPPEWVLL